MFFRLSGYRLDVSADEAHPFMIGLLETGECSYDSLLPWIGRSIVRL